MFNARQVTAIVWARSGFAERSRFIIFSDLAIFSRQIDSSKNVVFTPNSSKILLTLLSP